MSQKTLNFLEIRKFVQTNIRICLMAFSIVTLVLSGISMFSGISGQTAFGANILSCPTGETLSGLNCVANAQANNTYATNCPTGYTESYAICIKKRNITCSDPLFVSKAVDAEAGYCKFNPALFSATTGIDTSTSDVVSVSFVTDFDGRYCSSPVFVTAGNGQATASEVYNLKLFEPFQNNGNIATTKKSSYICANNLQASGPSKLGFRFKTFVLDTTAVLNTSNINTVVGEYQTVQTGTNYVCPTGYTLVDTSKCSRSAQPTNCTGGEYVLNGSCTICPSNKYCPANSTVGQSITICPNGGTLSTDKTKCVSPTGFKVSSVTQTDGCPAGYIKMDKSCAIVETRQHDLNCSYFYASTNSNLTAIQDTVNPTNSLSGQAINQCMFPTNGSFGANDIIKVSDLNCAGPNSAWYSYNVNYDPLICGFTALSGGVTGFRWSNLTYQKFTPLQKLDSSTLVCPQGWTVLETDNTLCYQPPITIVYRGPIDCPNGVTSNAGSINSSDCGETNKPVREITITKPTPTPTVVKTACISPMGYYTNSNGDCVMCPNGLITATTGATSMDQCITPYIAPRPTVVVTERAPLIRSGGSASLIAVVSALILTITGLSYFFVNSKGSYTKSWSKIK
jgi:hypothetical protein